MRKMIAAAAATMALTTTAFLVETRPVEAQTVSNPVAALQNGELQTSYAQYGRRRVYVGPRPYYRRGYNYGGAAAAGALGLATGAIIGGAIAQQQAPAYYGTPAYGAPVYAAPGDAVGYCMRRFRSYDPRSGTYLGNDGYRHACP